MVFWYCWCKVYKQGYSLKLLDLQYKQSNSGNITFTVNLQGNLRLIYNIKVYCWKTKIFNLKVLEDLYKSTMTIRGMLTCYQVLLLFIFDLIFYHYLLLLCSDCDVEFYYGLFCKSGRSILRICIIFKIFPLPLWYQSQTKLNSVSTKLQLIVHDNHFFIFR
jgi:hypothetical protein